VEATIERAERLIEHPGEYVQQLSKWLQDPELGIEKGRALRNSPDFLKETSKQWLGALRDSLRVRFPECSLFKWLATMFEPSAMCSDVAMADPSYGQAELDEVLDRFANDRKAASGCVVKPLVDRAGCKEQWPIFLRWARQTVVKMKEGKKREKEEEERKKLEQEKQEKKRKAHLKTKEEMKDEQEDEDEAEVEEQEDVEGDLNKKKHDASFRVSMSDLYSALSQNDSVTSLIPAVVKLFELAMVLPVTTADCERGFSVMNSVKTDLRASLKNPQLCRLMQIIINGPPVQDLDAHAAALRWHQRKPRRTKYRAADHSDSVSVQEVRSMPAVVADVHPVSDVRVGDSALTERADDDVFEVERPPAHGPPLTAANSVSASSPVSDSSPLRTQSTVIPAARDQQSDPAVQQRRDTHTLKGSWAAIFTTKTAGKKRKAPTGTTNTCNKPAANSESHIT
jgi:hypothetical protein